MHKLFKTKYYFISKFDSNSITKQDNKTVIIYRNYSIIPVDEKLIIKIRDFCRKNKKKFYLSNNIKIAIKLNLDGAYIPSFNKKLNERKFSIRKRFKIIGSAHNKFEISIKQRQKVDIIFLSPLFKTKDYLNGLGVVKFNLLSTFANNNVIALGGISKKNVKKVKMTNSIGFSGISYFNKSLIRLTSI